jgi:hypothetical protein
VPTGRNYGNGTTKRSIHVNSEYALAEAAVQSGVPPPTTLHGRWLLTARVVWIAVAILVLVLFVASVPIAYAQIHAVCREAECSFWRLAPEDVRALQEIGLSAGLYAAYNVALDVVYTLGFWAIGAAIFWRRSDNWMALLTSMALVAFGASNTLDILAEVHSAWSLPVAFTSFLGAISFFTLFYLFPDGRFVPRWTWVPAIVWVAYQVPYNFFPSWSSSEQTWPRLLDIWLTPVLLGTLVFAQIYRYVRVSGPVERQQTKWVVFGLTAASVGVIGAFLPRLIFPVLLQPGAPGVLYILVGYTVDTFASLLIPLSIGIAVLRYRLWDIDVIINRTLVYGVLTAILALVYFGGVALLQGVLSALTGQESQLAHSQLAVVASTLAIAGLFGPLRRRVQALIDRRFYRSKYDAAKTLEAFGAKMRDEVNLQKLTGELLAVTDTTVQPVHVSLWLRPPKRENVEEQLSETFSRSER